MGKVAGDLDIAGVDGVVAGLPQPIHQPRLAEWHGVVLAPWDERPCSERNTHHSVGALPTSRLSWQVWSLVQVAH